MATYDELLTIATTSIGGTLKNKIRVAAIVACDVIRSEAVNTANHANRLIWASRTLDNPGAAAEKLTWAVLAQNRAFTSAQITGADDASVQNAVNAAIDLIAQG
jgi:hypothetical protein